MSKKKPKVEKSLDDLQRDFWRTKGGDFRAWHDGSGDAGSMPADKLLPLLSELRHRPTVSWGPQLPGSIRGVARVLLINGVASGRFERWEEDGSMTAIDSVLRLLANTGSIQYERIAGEWDQFIYS